LDSLVPGSTSGSGNDTSTTPSDWQRFAPRSQVSAGLTLDPAQDYLASPWPSPTGQPPSRSSMRSSGGWTGFKQRRRSCASPMLRLCTRAWRTTDAARDGPLPVVVELGLPLLRVGGRLLVPRGQPPAEELHQATVACEQLGGRVELVVPNPSSPIDRVGFVVIMAKIAATSPRFPRRSGVPARTPLGQLRKHER
jgi:hypothetical protein